MLTATGQDQGISHGLQIRKDQEERSQDARRGCQFNTIGFIDNSPISAETRGPQREFERKLCYDDDDCFYYFQQ